MPDFQGKKPAFKYRCLKSLEGKTLNQLSKVRLPTFIQERCQLPDPISRITIPMAPETCTAATISPKNTIKRCDSMHCISHFLPTVGIRIIWGQNQAILMLFKKNYIFLNYANVLTHSNFSQDFKVSEFNPDLCGFLLCLCPEPGHILIWVLTHLLQRAPVVYSHQICQASLKQFGKQPYLKSQVSPRIRGEKKF